MTSRRLHHLAVLVRDLARAEAFYVDVVGLPVERRWFDDHGAPRSVWLGLGDGAFLAIERAPEGPDPTDRGDVVLEDHARAPRPGWYCVALAIEPLERETLRQRFAAAGFPIERETSYTLYTRDPEGNVVALSHHPFPSAENVGTGSDALRGT